MRFISCIWSYVTHDNIIAAATVLIAVFTWTLWRSNEKLWEAGEDQRKLYEKTAERQLRAYVSMDAGAIIFDESTGIAAAYVTLKNYGTTPAYKFRAWATLATKMSNEPPPFDEGGKSYSITVIGPTATLDQSVEQKFSTTMLHQIIAGERAIYLYGRVDYVDAFGIDRWLIWKRAMKGKLGFVAFKELRGPGWGLIPDPSGDEAN